MGHVTEKAIFERVRNTQIPIILRSLIVSVDYLLFVVLVNLYADIDGLDHAPRLYFFFSCLTQLSMKISLLINMKMPT